MDRKHEVSTATAESKVAGESEGEQNLDERSENMLANLMMTGAKLSTSTRPIQEEDVANVADSEDWEIVGYLSRDQIHIINSAPCPCEDPRHHESSAYKEIEWPTLYFKMFTCFPRLPLEIRRKIWLYALPEPRLVQVSFYWAYGDKDPLVVNLEIHDFVSSTPYGRGNATHLDVRQLYLTCRESREVFLEHYKKFVFRTPHGGHFLYTPPERRRGSMDTEDCRLNNIIPHPYIDPKVDTLKFDYPEKILECLDALGMDLSSIANIAIARYSRSDDSISIQHSALRIIEKSFPHLRSLTLIGNFRQGQADEMLRNVCAVPHLQPLNHDTVNELGRQVTALHRDGPLANNFQQMQQVAKEADKCKENILDQSLDNPEYWKRVDLTVSLWMNHTVHRAEDYIQLRPKRPVEGLPCKIYYTQAVGPHELGNAELTWFGSRFFLDCYADRTLFNRSKDIEESRKVHQALYSKRKKYLTWPWNQESTEKSDGDDSSRFTGQSMID